MAIAADPYIIAYIEALAALEFVNASKWVGVAVTNAWILYAEPTEEGSLHNGFSIMTLMVF